MVSRVGEVSMMSRVVGMGMRSKEEEEEKEEEKRAYDNDNEVSKNGREQK